MGDLGCIILGPATARREGHISAGLLGAPAGGRNSIRTTGWSP